MNWAVSIAPFDSPPMIVGTRASRPNSARSRRTVVDRKTVSGRPAAAARPQHSPESHDENWPAGETSSHP